MRNIIFFLFVLPVCIQAQNKIPTVANVDSIAKKIVKDGVGGIRTDTAHTVAVHNINGVLSAELNTNLEVDNPSAMPRRPGILATTLRLDSASQLLNTRIDSVIANSGGIRTVEVFNDIVQPSSGQELVFIENEHTLNLVSQDSIRTIQTTARAFYNPIADNTNYLPDGDAFDQWQLNENTATANAAINSDGNPIADKIIPTTTTTNHTFLKATVLTVGTSYFLTLEAKPAGFNRIYVQIKNTNGFADMATYVVDLSTGSVISNTNDGGLTVTAKANGYYEIKQHFTQTATNNGYVFITPLENGETSENQVLTGDGNKGILFSKAKINIAP